MSKKKWELKLKNVEELVSQSNESLYQRVTLLVEVFEDQRFHDHHDGDMDAMEAHLNKYLGDYGIDFFDARAIRKHYPTAAAWRDGNLREMLAQSLDKETRESTATVTTRPRIKREDHEKALAQIERLEKANEAYQDDNTALRNRVNQLENALAVANGRIEELKSLLEPRLAGV